MTKAQSAFLRRLRAGGRSNMYGAIPYLINAFGIDRESAFRIVCDWVDQQPTTERGGDACVAPSRRAMPTSPPRRHVRSAAR